jgi:hypothetical protein
MKLFFEKRVGAAKVAEKKKKTKPEVGSAERPKDYKALEQQGAVSDKLKFGI